MDFVAAVGGGVRLAARETEEDAMKVAAIVLNWNRPEETAACCRSLAAQTHRDLGIWVVDNGSTANTAEELAAACPQATVVRLEENLGFAGGVNAGIRAAREAGEFDFAWLVNNDAICDPEALQRMLAVALRDRRTAAVGCEMLENGPAGKPRHVAAGKRLRPPFFIPTEVKVSTEVDYLCGACLLMRREALDEVGPLDDGFFFFFEDADWCFRARAMGWRLGVADEALVHHTGSATIGSMSRLKAAHYRAGHVRFLRIHARHPVLAAVPVTGYRLLAEILRFRWASAAGTFDGWRRGWR
jgi:GT2 family glycosyltransferase